MKLIKTILLTALIFGCTIISSSQTWAPVGAKWSYTLRFATSGDIDTLVIRSIGDTTIQGKPCRILHKSAVTCDVRLANEYMYSDSGKVFFFDNSRSKFQMLFNINAAISTSWVIYFRDLPNNDSVVVKVDSVFTTTINGIVLKEIHVSYPNCSSPWNIEGSGRIIENIGDTYYMFPWVSGVCDDDFGGPLRCYDDPVIGHYETGMAPSCDFRNVAINEKRLNEVKIYPNPVTRAVTIETANEPNPGKDYVEIDDLFGREIFVTSLSGTNSFVDLSQQPLGVYLLKIHFKDSVSIKKIIKID